VKAAIDPMLPTDPRPEHVWYASYGSNMHLDRLALYIKGGHPPGTTTMYPGCRDPRMPSRSVPVELAGALYFAAESAVWGGGRAFYDPEADGRVLARAHLITSGQFSDIAAQEMYHAPGPPPDLTEVLTTGRAVLGPGRYETLLCPGRLESLPVLTFTAHWSMNDVRRNPPSATYVRFLAAGLLAAGAWDVAEVTSYLAACPGVAGHWTEEAITDLLRDPDVR
jgi:hypothetical protein